MEEQQDGSILKNHWGKLKGWMSRHKPATVILVIVLVVLIALTALGVMSWMSTTLSTRDTAEMKPLSYDDAAPEEAAISPSGPREVVERDVAMETDRPLDADEGVDTEDIPGVEIKEAGLRAESEQAASDEELVRDITERYNGYIEKSDKSEDERRIRISMIARVPSGSFEEFLLELREELELEEYNISDYRIETEARESELEIIREMQEALQEIRQETREMEIGEERIRLLEDIVERQKRYRQQEENILQQLDKVRYRGKMATVNVVITEDIKASIWPEDLGESFRREVKSMVEEVVSIGINILTSTLVILLSVIQFLIYVLVVIIPIWIVVRLLWRAFNKLYR